MLYIRPFLMSSKNLNINNGQSNIEQMLRAILLQLIVSIITLIGTYMHNLINFPCI